MIRQEMYHLFPFDKIEKGSNIIIYGYGSMGRQYMEQLDKTEYCTVKYVVDKRWTEINSSYDIRNPEAVLEDKDALIVVSTDRYAAEVIKWLRGKGISSDRIIFKNIELNAYSGQEKSISDTDLLFLNSFRGLISIMDVDSDMKLVRVGKDFDGGYIMLNDFAKSGGVAYSFGINNDVSWDKDMANRGYEIFMYDHTIDGLPENNHRFHWEKKGIAKEFVEGSCCDTLDNILKANHHENCKNMILKMDVEGAEWGCFEVTTSETLNRFDQIALELHGITYFKDNDLILSVLRKINETHQCIHVHLNNYSEVIMDDNIPFAGSVEVTYVNKTNRVFKKSEKVLPCELDLPCNPNEKDIILNKYYNK